MLVELGLVEQHYKPVLEVLVDGATVTEVAQRLGVSRQTVHSCCGAMGTAGWPTLTNRSSRPDRCPHQTTVDLEATIVTPRRAHPAWGPQRIRIELDRACVEPLPARSTVYRIPVRKGLVDPQRRRRRREDYRHWESSRSMELGRWTSWAGSASPTAPSCRGHRDRRPLPLLRLALLVPNATQSRCAPIA